MARGRGISGGKSWVGLAGESFPEWGGGVCGPGWGGTRLSLGCRQAQGVACTLHPSIIVIPELASPWEPCPRALAHDLPAWESVLTPGWGLPSHTPARPTWCHLEMTWEDGVASSQVLSPGVWPSLTCSLSRCLLLGMSGERDEGGVWSLWGG